MQRNYTNKGNAEWQELAKPRQPEKVKLRLTPLDVYARRGENPIALRGSNTASCGGGGPVRPSSTH